MKKLNSLINISILFLIIALSYFPNICFAQETEETNYASHFIVLSIIGIILVVIYYKKRKSEEEEKRKKRLGHTHGKIGRDKIHRG